MPVPKDTGISKGYLRTADGIAHFADTGGLDRGGIVWGGVLYRVCGGSLVRVYQDGSLSIIGSVGSGGRCSFDYSFDRLAISSDGRFYYYNGTALTRVTDADLGVVVDHVWIDGYHVTTDGEFIVVTELNDPTAVNPLKYGSSEFDPDDVLGLLKVRNELVVLNRHSIEVFDNVGGELFPFQRIDGAVIQKALLALMQNARLPKHLPLLVVVAMSRSAFILAQVVVLKRLPHARSNQSSLNTLNRNCLAWWWSLVSTKRTNACISICSTKRWFMTWQDRRLLASRFGLF